MDYSRKASLRPVLFQLITNNITLREALKWFGAGSRWGRLAAAGKSPGLWFDSKFDSKTGSIYLLMILTLRPEMVERLRSQRVTSTTIIALCNEIRHPSTEGMFQLEVLKLC